MRGRLLLGAASAALIALCSTAAAQEDPADGANTQARLTIGQAVDGGIDPVGDGDWFRVRLEQGQRYTFTLDAVAGQDGAQIDPLLTLYDTNGNQLAINDDAPSGGTLNSALSYIPTQSGDVFLEASALGDMTTGGYRLNSSSGPAPADNAGNDRTTRSRINVGATVNGEIEFEGDVDWYRLRASSNQRYRINLNSDAQSSSPLRDPLLRVLDRNGNELAVNDDFEGLNSQLEFSPDASGEVFIEASGLGGAQTGAYTLSVTSERAQSDGNSGSTSTRGRINPGQTINAAMEYAGDRDWYRIRLTEGESYRFTLNSSGDSPLSDPLLLIHDGEGEMLAADDDGGDGLNSYLEFTAPSTGNYFVEARGFDENGTGGYTLSALRGDIPGDNTTDASLSADGDYRDGMLSPAGDRDWYKITLSEGQAFRVSLMSDPANPESLSDPYLALYGADGTQIAMDDDGGEGLNAWLEYQATTAGAYYIEARGFLDDAQGRYQLTLTPGEISGDPSSPEVLQANNDGRMSIIGAQGDVDWFVIETIEGRPYRFNLEAAETDALGDPMLTLYDSSGTEIVSDDDGGTGLNAYINYASPTGGPIFAAVSSYGGQGTGRYVLRVVDTDVPGHAYTDENLNALDDYRISRIEMPGDLDYYRVMLESGVRYVVTVDADGAHPLADPFVSIMNEENASQASDDDSGNGRNARLRFTPQTSGAYYIAASGHGGTTGGYKVSIVRQ